MSMINDEYKGGYHYFVQPMIKRVSVEDLI